jgi:MFS family permease
VFPLRVLTGASLATVVTAASTYLADVAPAHRRSEVMGYYGIANSLAFAVGPALGGYIIHAGALDGFNGMLLSHAGWSSGARTGDLHFTTLFLVAAGLAFAAAAGAAALPVTGSRAAAAAPGTRPMAGRAAFFPAGVNAAGSFGFAALVAFLPLYARDHGTENPGVLFIAYAAGLITVRLLAGRWLERLPRGTVAAAGLFCAGAALVSIAGFPARTGLMAAAALYGVGAGLYQPALMAYLVDRIDPRARGRALGTFTLGADLGLSSGSFALGVVIDAGGFAPAFVLAACVVTAGGVAIAVGARPRPAAAGT